MTAWKPIKSFRGPDYREVDLWLQVSDSVYGRDSWRVTNARRIEGKWFDRVDGKWMELEAGYITHWMPIKRPPKILRKNRHA
jgi:L-ascorbate metabolism protein UlaG (beta-lactamase superfamily)